MQTPWPALTTHRHTHTLSISHCILRGLHRDTVCSLWRARHGWVKRWGLCVCVCFCLVQCVSVGVRSSPGAGWLMAIREKSKTSQRIQTSASLSLFLSLCVCMSLSGSTLFLHTSYCLSVLYFFLTIIVFLYNFDMMMTKCIAHHFPGPLQIISSSCL